LPPPPPTPLGRAVLSHLAIIIAGAIAAATIGGIAFYATIPEGRVRQIPFAIAVMAFAGAILASLLTRRTICYSMVAGSFIGSLASLPDMNAKFYDPFIPLAKMATGMGVGFLIGSCWATGKRPLSVKKP
jgi:hypothetical protein